MTLLQALLLGIIQGIAEFLPISSSGHLVLAEAFFGLQLDELKGFDVILHAGTLLAMFVYFWKDIVALLTKKSKHRLLGYLVLATLPAVAAGLTLEEWLDEVFRDPRSVLVMLLVLGAFFVVAERFPRAKNSTRFTLRNTLVMGVAQACALIPGISRSGSVIGTGLLFGLKREEAAKFAFLLGIPAIGGATVLTGLHVVSGDAQLPGAALVAVGFLTSLVVGYASVAFLMKFLKTHSLNVFTMYLIVVGVAGLYLFSLPDPSVLNSLGP